MLGLPAATAPAAVALALRICDDLSRQQVTPRLIEQFALSVALAETGPLVPAHPYIGHYWSNKAEWNEPIAAFLLASHLQQRTVAEETTALSAFDFRAVPVRKNQRNTRWRLHHLVDRLFPARNIEYAGEKQEE